MSASQLDRVSFIVLRNMRTPIIILVCVYAVCILGMVMVPGLPDANGSTTYLSFFHAYYFLAYTATTTGFGELPGEFSNAQRMWAVVCLYTSVVTWLYAVGKIIALVRNPHLQAAIDETRFARAVAKKKRDFYIVCGFGDTGSLLLRGLDDAGLSTVVIESNDERIKALELRDYQMKVLGLCADATQPRFLLDAGIESEKCIGILILSNDEATNLKVAVSARILRPDLKIICRSASTENESEILSVGGDIHVVDPFRVFASYLSMIIYNPTIQTINEWISGSSGAMLDHNICPLKGGKWILCGHGRMGRVIYKKLSDKQIDITVVEPNVERIERIAEHAILGRANLENLEKAGLKDCVGLIAGTDNDTFNLSMIHQANRVNPALFSMVRQNKHTNEILFKRAQVDYIMQPSLVIARMVLFMLTAPLLKPFFSYLRLVYENDPSRLADITNRLATEVGGEAPMLKTYSFTQEKAPAVYQKLFERTEVKLGDICRDPAIQTDFLKIVPLVHKRGKTIKVLPPNDLVLMTEDEILFCMRPSQAVYFEANISNIHLLDYLLTGVEPARGGFFRWLESRGVAS
ncbi:MAG TPA: potassium transporter [Cycloclasticus sp.]|jgi:Trk K+ transport system NAD-binding subunit|nr:potassium transporter [Cycloclasticus sp.]HIL93639.1 potassium transporter [Cycloclasticus sp.]